LTISNTTTGVNLLYECLVLGNRKVLNQPAVN